MEGWPRSGGGNPCGVLPNPSTPSSSRSSPTQASSLIAPYLDNNRSKICEGCAFLHSSFCPCPMDYLAVLVVEAVEAVDRRRDHRARISALLSPLPGPEEVAGAYEEAAGTWTGCDWPTCFGPAHLNLRGYTAAQAHARAINAASPQESENWAAAGHWLAEVERKAKQAQAQAALAVAAAKTGEWRQAAEFARRAWALEFATGRPLRRFPPTWQPLYEAIAAVAFQTSPNRVGVG